MTKPLPRRIQEQLDQADAALQQFNAAPEQAAPEPAPAPEPAVEPVPQPEPAPAPANDEYARLDQKYRSLQGVHRSLEDRIRQTSGENQRLAQELDALKRKLAEGPAPAPAVDHKDSEVFGPDLVDMVVRQVDGKLTAFGRMVDDRLKHLESRIVGASQAVAQTAEEVFMARLKEAVPDYAEINVDPGFLQWLAEEDPVHGMPRQKALDVASQRLNVEHTAKVFLAWKKLNAPAAAAPAAKSAAESELERQIAPSSAAAPAPASRAAQSYILTSDVAAFYREVAQGKYRGRDQERMAIEQTINNALAANRVLDKPPRQSV